MENENRANLLRVHEALQEKGYNPIGQIVGYLLTEDPTYITNHLGARNLIRKIDRYSLLADIVAAYFDDTEGESGGRPAAGPPAFISYVSSSPTYNHWLPIFTVLLGTGCRIGEVVGLRWQDCDFAEGIISINHNLVYRKREKTGKMGFHITTPKTNAGIRIIPMLEEVRRALKRLVAVKTADAINAIKGVLVSADAKLLSEKWVRGELTGEQMKQELLDLHRKIAAEENRSDY